MEQAKFSADAFIMSAFRYCVLIWMSCGKVSNRLINKVHKRALRTVYKCYNLEFDDLLSIENSVPIYTKCAVINV